MKILMTETRRGTVDGHSVQRFYQGEAYEVPNHLGRFLLSRNYAVEVGNEENE